MRCDVDRSIAGNRRHLILIGYSPAIGHGRCAHPGGGEPENTSER